MPYLGQILCYRNFEFENGSKKDKLFVALNDSDKDLVCLALKTTSQSKHYEGAQQGCNPQKKAFFVPAGWQHCFTVDTYIQLPQIFQITADELLVGGISSRITISSSLTPECFALLKSCLKQFKNDISLQHWKLIFKS